MPPKRDLKQVDSEPEDVEDAIEVREDTEKQRKISEELNEKQIGIRSALLGSGSTIRHCHRQCQCS